MMHVYRHSHARHVLFAVAFALVITGCMTEGQSMTAPPTDAGAYDAAIAVDPTGNWNVAYSFMPGCSQQMAMESSTFTVTLSAQGYAVAVPSVTVTGTLFCTAVNCKLSGMFTWSAGTSQFQRNANIALDAQGKITGNGTEFVTGTATCNVAFSVTGTKT